MPGRDRTGPLGAGPRTGRGMGYCGSNDQGRFDNLASDRRSGFSFRSWGAGRGWRHRFYATGIPGWVTPTPEQQTADLKAQLDAIQKRIDELTTN